MSEHRRHNGNGRDHDAEEEEAENVISFPSLAERDRARREQEKAWRKTQREPFLNLPPATRYLVVSLLVIHVVTDLLIGPAYQGWVLDRFGFVPARYTGGIPFGWSAFVSPLTYMFLHGGWLHFLLNTVMLTALGAGLEKWMGGRKMLALFLLCGLVSAAVHFAFSPFSSMPVVGASGGISGLFAAALFMLQQRGMLPTGRYGLWPFILLWIVISALFGLVGGPDGSPVAWAAHIGGFLAGFLLLKPVLRSQII